MPIAKQLSGLSVISLFVILISGCGELAFKRGANVVDLQQVQQECKSKGGDRAVYEKCMSENGWVVQQMDDVDPVATSFANTDNRGFTEPEAEPAVKAESGAKQEAFPVASSAPRKPADMMDKFVIGSWWKRGGNADMLDDAIAACVTTLGAANQPVMNPQNGARAVTRGLLLCLRQQGWYGLQNK